MLGVSFAVSKHTYIPPKRYELKANVNVLWMHTNEPRNAEKNPVGGLVIDILVIIMSNDDYSMFVAADSSN